MSAILEKNQLLRKAILKHLYYRKMLSVTDLSKLTQKSQPLVSATIYSLIEDGLIIEHGQAPSTGGRRPAAYYLNPQLKKYVLAVAMDQLTTRMNIYNISGQAVIKEESVKFNISHEVDGIEKLIDIIKKFIGKSGIADSDIIGIGIGMPGFVNAEKGINQSHLKPSTGEGLATYLSNSIKIPVFIDNDSSLIALAELRFGLATKVKNALVVNIGWGTGLGMIVNGQLYRGSSGYAGEFSHIPLSLSNALCSCGKRGCLEVDTSLLVMAENAKTAMKNGAVSCLSEMFLDESKHPGDHFLAAVIKQDPLAVSVLSTAVFQLGKGIATLIHIMNPETIILSGRVATVGRLLLPPIQQALNEFCIPRIAEQTTIQVSDSASDSELIAAASLVVENIGFT